MNHSINCRINNESDQELVNMNFEVHLREAGEPKLSGLYTNFDTVEPGSPPSLLSEDTVNGALTHEAEIVNLKALTDLFANQGRTTTNESLHVHTDTEGVPYVCWAGFTPELDQMLTIIKAWTVFNTVNATANPPIDPNSIGNPLDLIDQFNLRVEISINS